MYLKSDPRSKMASAKPAAAKSDATDFGPSYYARFYEEEPQEITETSRNWYIRSQNAVLAYGWAEDGTVFEREDQPDEFAFLLPDHSATAEITAGGETKTVDGSTLTFVPPGKSIIKINGAGSVIRVYTVRSEDLVALCSNSVGYVDDPNVPELENWPDPKDGFRIRTYNLDTPPEEGRFGRIYRSTTLMINYIYPTIGRRPPEAMSPHSHDDFQQFSLSLDGSWVHHLRTSWSTDLTKWTTDEHEYCASPSAAVIPAQIIHTSEAASHARNQLVDIFCPPRVDFSKQPGWVLNPDDYPEKE